MSVSERKFGVLQTGETVKIFHLENKSGAYAEVTDFGAILVKVCVPDKDGTLADVVLGYDDLASYEVNGCFFGSTIGRNGNRIGGAKFSVNGKEVVLAQNENDNNLHSGPDGFEKKLWKVAEISDDKNSVIFNRISPDGENGFPGEFDVSLILSRKSPHLEENYPGNLDVEVTFNIYENYKIEEIYKGKSDKTTLVNMTNHSYFNLNGEGSGTAMDQYLTIHAKYYTPVADSHSIPTGVYEEVAGTPMDFRTAKQIGQDIEAEFEQLKFTGGYDHNYVTDNYAKGNRRLIATAYSDKTGIAMDVTSDCPCVQFYAANFVENEHGKNGHTYNKRDAFCLETQVEPNAVNVEDFHSPILNAGEQYDSVTAYHFYIRK